MERGLFAPIRGVLGTFDGVHAGHRALFSRACTLARADGYTVGAVVIDRPGTDKLCTSEEREELLLAAGAQRIFVFPLDEVRTLSPEEFVALLTERCGVRACVCGYDFRFGAHRTGSAETLGELIAAEVVPAQRLDGCIISSTEIRRLLASGDAALAARMLGRPYRVSGTVVHGQALGRKMGFPTANIAFPADSAVPRRGVYCTKVHTPAGVWNAVTNVGTRPTVNGTGVRAESYLFDYGGDCLYGERITVEFLEFLRAETRFDSVAELTARIGQDLSRAREYFM